MKSIEIYLDLNNEQHHVGTLNCLLKNGRESYSYYLSEGWKNSHLKPLFTPQFGEHDNSVDIISTLSDTSPDRWGRNLMRLSEDYNAKKEYRKVRQLFESDFITLVDDMSRQGAIRFKETGGNIFLSSNENSVIPPLLSLPELLNASENIWNNADDQFLKYLLKPGASVGGARPKAIISDANKLFIAKFPKLQEVGECDIPAWEYVVMQLSNMTGVRTANSRLVKVSGKNVLLSERFDRENGMRIPYMSAMSMLQAYDGDDEHSYLEIADIIEKYGNKDDLMELFKRVVNNVLIHNVDDHLRNHGFLFNNDHWILSPVFDLNPVSNSEYLSLNITDSRMSTIANCLEFASYIDIDETIAKEYIASAGNIISSNWRQIAHNVKIPQSEIERMSNAFEHGEMTCALNLDKGYGCCR